MSRLKFNIVTFLTKKFVLFYGITALILLGISYIPNNIDSATRATKTIQKKVVQRQKLLDEYVQKALKIPADQWMEFESFPEDMVIYKYNADTLQSWSNLFPISNDEVDLLPFWYRIHDMNNRNLFNTPLAYLTNREQYVNLGSSWYIVNVVKKGRIKIISGLLIKNEYLSQNSVLTNKVNPKLKLDKHYTTVPVNESDAYVVFNKKNEALFSIVSDMPATYVSNTPTLKWLALLFVLFSLFSYHFNKRNYKSLSLVIIGLAIIRWLTILLGRGSLFDSQFFSPNLYAQGEFFDSLGSLLVNHLIVFLAISSLFVIRKRIMKDYYSHNLLVKRVIKGILLILPIGLAVYIHLSLRSLALNSNIILELYRLEEISIYTVLVYFSYGLLFMALLFSLQFLKIVFIRKKKLSFFSVKSMVLYILFTSFYMVIAVSSYGFKKEYERTRVWTNKLAVERDISLEMHLRSVERHIAIDPLVRLLISVPNGEDLIRSRISELYLWNITKLYDIGVTICAEGDLLKTEQYAHPVDCNAFFINEIISKYGIPLAPNSTFFYIDKYRNSVSYLGVFTWYKNGQRYNMFLEINSKIANEAIGYPSILLDLQKKDKNNMPSYYSYAKYYNNRLTSYKGRYNYPVYYTSELKDGYSYFRKSGYLHFVNKIFEDNVIIVSRKTRSFAPYLVFYSYIVLFFGGIIFGFTRLRRFRKGEKISIPTNSFRTKITYLLTAAMVFALICMGIGSVIFTINLINENNRIQMEEKLHTVQTTISEMCKYAVVYNEINTSEMFNAMDKVSANTQVDINLFDPHGNLIRSTKPEVFEQFLLSSRMNPVAFKNLIYDHKRQFIQQENISDLKYNSLYAPIFNINGVLIAIANVPYFLNTSEFREDSTSIIATIINLYLLLLLAAILGGTAISNSITKPLAKISEKMRGIDFSQKAEHINYKSKDELGMLVGAYNKMVDDLEESTKQLAQSEREQAWREMARQIAHEIKNPLTPMRLSIQHLVRLKHQNVPDWAERFDALSTSLLEQIDILSDTATEFSSFAKFFNEDNAIIDINGLLKEQYVLFDNRDNIDFTFSSDFEVAYVFARKGQLTRAFVNLISNAIQAIENKKDGIVRVTISEDPTAKYFCVSIEDNGAGVSEENLCKLFKPNFTTKSGGTGLGLAICKNIMDQSQGTISYSKSKLGGANFIVLLPKYLS